jgi:probable HAF family extracellular repeat protein
MGKRFGAGLAVLTLLLAGATRARAEYIVTSLPFGGALNDSGQVVGAVKGGGFWAGADYQHQVLFYQAAMYSNGKVITLAPGGSMEEGTSKAYGINDKGQVVGTMRGGVFLYSNGKLTNLGNEIPSSFNVAINNAGQVVAAAGGAPNYGMSLYSNGKWTPLSTNWANNVAINASGQIAGTVNDASGQHAFLYSGGKMTNIGTPGFKSWAYGINDSGQVAGVDFKTGTAALFSGGKSIDLGTLVKGDYRGGYSIGNGGAYSIAFGINNAGQIVGESMVNITGNFTPHAFLFTNGKMLDLNDLINHTPDFILTNAGAINNRGQILAGGIYKGANPSDPNSYGTYLLTPTDPLATPEPGSLTLLALGALGLAGHAWRKRRRSRITGCAPCTAAAPARNGSRLREQ